MARGTIVRGVIVCGVVVWWAIGIGGNCPWGIVLRAIGMGGNFLGEFFRGVLVGG